MNKQSLKFHQFLGTFQWINKFKNYLIILNNQDSLTINGAKAIDHKRVFKTKRDSLGNIERYKAGLNAKGFTKKEGINYIETFSPVSKKYSLCIILALVAHFNLELQQMDVKMTFLNGDQEDEVYMTFLGKVNILFASLTNPNTI